MYGPIPPLRQILTTEQDNIHRLHMYPNSAHTHHELQEPEIYKKCRTVTEQEVPENGSNARNATLSQSKEIGFCWGADTNDFTGFAGR
jgi:hypothetical protein